MKMFYYHGGPGLNSNPEKALLAETFLSFGWDVEFWNEPSSLRPDGPVWRDTDAYANYLSRAEEFLLQGNDSGKVGLIGHSFGCHAIRYLSKKYPERLRVCVFISSALSLADADRNIFNFTLEDFRRSHDPRWKELAEVSRRYKGEFDNYARRAFELVLENQHLFDHYWRDGESKKLFLQHFSDPKYAVDAAGFFAVRSSWYNVPLEKCGVPAIAMFGRHDAVISVASEIALLKKNYAALSVYHLENSGHYPHVEEKDATLKVLQRAVPPGFTGS